MTELVNRPSFIEAPNKKFRFLIMDAPKDSNLHLYLKVCSEHNVKCIVRISEPSYPKEEVEKQGIALYESYYHDGSSPPADIIGNCAEFIIYLYTRWCVHIFPCPFSICFPLSYSIYIYLYLSTSSLSCCLLHVSFLF
jgi:hypothetical protein